MKWGCKLAVAKLNGGLGSVESGENGILNIIKKDLIKVGTDGYVEGGRS